MLKQTQSGPENFIERFFRETWGSKRKVVSLVSLRKFWIRSNKLRQILCDIIEVKVIVIFDFRNVTECIGI